jgi:excisionase family DNA binding protein
MRVSIPPEKILYTTEEAAASLGIGVTKTKELIRSSELRSIKIGRHRRIPVAALMEFVVLREMIANGGEE